MNLSAEQLLERLESVIDPEVGLNIVHLGLVYDVSVDEAGRARVEMTLTTPGCPMSSYITTEVNKTLKAVEGVTEVRVDLVWSPPWNPEMILPEALKELRNRPE